MLRKLILFHLLFFVLLPACAESASIPTVEDLRGALFVCSGGQVRSQSFSGYADVDGFLGLLRRNIGGSLGAGGEATSQDIGKVFEQTFDEGERYEIFRLYNDCLQNFVRPIISKEGGSGPGIQKLAEFSIVTHEAYEIDDLITITVGLSGFNNPRYLGLLKSSFRGLSSTGSIYTLGDTGGLPDCTDTKDRNTCGVAVKSGATISAIITFERVGGRPAEKSEGKTFSFSGTIVYARDEHNIGIRQIPLVRLD